jgi:glutathionyl-hydroquinone reductase
MHTLRILSVFIICIFLGLIVEAQTDSLYQTIVRLDSIYFDAYNKCDIPKQSGLYADTIEFLP